MPNVLTSTRSNHPEGTFCKARRGVPNDKADARRSALIGCRSMDEVKMMQRHLARSQTDIQDVVFAHLQRDMLAATKEVVIVRDLNMGTPMGV